MAPRRLPALDRRFMRYAAQQYFDRSAHRHHADDARPRRDNLDFRDVRLKPLTSRGFSPAVISAPVVIACEGRPCSTPGRGARLPPVHIVAPASLSTEEASRTAARYASG